MSVAPFHCEVIDEPAPPRRPFRKPATQREAMFTLLGTMEVNGNGLQVNRVIRSVQDYVQRFRQSIDPSAQFILRVERVGWTRIWRVK